ncbi:MAG: helix-turn-helix transcriptional regulator [Nitrospira sp.]
MAFAKHVVSSFPALISSDRTTFDEMDLANKHTVAVWHPADNALRETLVPVFSRYMNQNPSVAYLSDTRFDGAVKWSDFMTGRQFKRQALYQECYRRLGVKHQIGLALSVTPSALIPISLNRGLKDFTEQDRLILNLIRPHLIQALLNAQIVTQYQEECQRLDSVMQRVRMGVIELTGQGGIERTSHAASLWLESYFNAPRSSDMLPEKLRRWVCQQDKRWTDMSQLPAPDRALVVDRGYRKMVIRFIREEERRTLFMEERVKGMEVDALVQFGLTRREAEILQFLTLSRTNAEIAGALQISPRTVQSVVERIFDKLGVDTRTAAATCAMQLSSDFVSQFQH